MPHTHSPPRHAGGGPGAVTFETILNDPTQQLDERSEVIAKIPALDHGCGRLTTAEREWFGHAMTYDEQVSIIETLLADRVARAYLGGAK